MADGIVDFVLSLVAMSALSGLACYLYNKGALSRHIKLVVSLCVVATVTTGVVGLLDGISISEYFADLDKKADEYFDCVQERIDELVIEESRQKIENTIKQEIFENYGIYPDECRIQFDIRKSENITEVAIREIKLAFSTNPPQGVCELVKGLVGKQPVLG